MDYDIHFYDYKYIYNQYKYILTYLQLLGECCSIVHFLGGSYLVFNNGIKNNELKKKLSPYIIITDSLVINPINYSLKNKIASIIFSF